MDTHENESEESSMAGIDKMMEHESPAPTRDAFAKAVAAMVANSTGDKWQQATQTIDAYAYHLEQKVEGLDLALREFVFGQLLYMVFHCPCTRRGQEKCYVCKDHDVAIQRFRDSKTKHRLVYEISSDLIPELRAEKT